jgi:hypothetical protein
MAMELDRYEQQTGARRLTGEWKQRSARAPLSTRGTFLFGLPFVGAGTVIALIGIKVIAVDPATVHAPYWIVAAMGFVFAFAGIFLWRAGWRQYRSNRRRAAMLERHVSEPALVDYPWDPRGFEPARWSKLIKSLVAIGGVTLFLSAFNWWAFFADGPWPVKAIVSFFDLILLIGWIRAAMAIGRTLKFGPSRIEFARFPYRRTEPAVVRWMTPAGIGTATKGTFTLRCVAEWYETTRSNGESQERLVHEQNWAGTWSLERPREFPAGKMIELRFELPAEMEPTCFNNSTARAIYWELEVKLDLPGLNFSETYLVPVY